MSCYKLCIGDRSISVQSAICGGQFIDCPAICVCPANCLLIGSRIKLIDSPYVFGGYTREKRHSFVGGFKFVGTNEYIQIIFISPETNEYFYIRRF
jgi:hypothetical protein